MRRADYAGACHRAARCAVPVGSNPPCELHLASCDSWAPHPCLPDRRHAGRAARARRAQANFTFQTATAISATDSRSRRTNGARFACIFGHLKHQRAWGTPGAPMRRSLACEVVERKCTRVFTAVAPEITRHPRTQWFYGLIRDLPGEPCTVATVALGSRFCPTRLSRTSLRKT